MSATQTCVPALVSGAVASPPTTEVPGQLVEQPPGVDTTYTEVLP